MEKRVWVFVSAGSRYTFPSGIFSTLRMAEEWILKHELTGMLTEYPLDSGVYDWAVAKGYYQTKPADNKKRDMASLIGGFSAKEQKQFHYVSGRRTE